MPEATPISGSGAVESLVREACDADLASPGAADAQQRLRKLGERLAQGRLQLAVVGQFKRGKSTLLNALLGADLLPSAVTPLTAIPAYIQYGPALRLSTLYASAEAEDFSVADMAALRKLLAARVTEDENPKNRLGVRRVEIALPADLLKTGMVFLDTPGVGSTYRHNTDAAKAALPECDMALFVVSPDPPITETEVAYLKELQEAAANIVVILNKIDLVEGSDRARSLEFLTRTVAETTGTAPAAIFCVSGRRGLEAKLRADREALRMSGLCELEAYLEDFARTRRSTVLQQAVARKAAALVRDMVFEADLLLAAYRMPLIDLSERLSRFEVLERKFAKARNESHDLLQGDRKRLLGELDERAARLRAHVVEALEPEIDASVARSDAEADIAARLRQKMPALFQVAFERMEREFRESLESMLAVHQKRGDELIAAVRQAAADLLAVPFTAPAAQDAFTADKTPYWVTTPRESLAFGAGGAFDAILPGVLRRKRLYERLAGESREIVSRNVENLRWSIRQNLEEAIRKFEAELDERLELSQRATREAIRRGLERRGRAETDAREEIARLAAARGRLEEIAQTLQVTYGNGS